MNNYSLRIIDANCNRLAEGLRVLEDISRFILNDVVLSKQLKKTRHSIIREINQIGIGLISNRNSEDDIGAGIESLEYKNDLLSIVAANSKRTEEALRVIEEISKSTPISKILNPIILKTARYSIYSIERKLLSKLLRREKVKNIEGLYSIIDTMLIPGKDPSQITMKLIRGGAKVIQLRDKTDNKRKILSIAKSIKRICKDNNVLFIINDYADIAEIINADGLHIGQEDLPVKDVRNLLPIDTIIGCSINTIAQAKKAAVDGADYIAVGAIFPTTTKNNIKIVGIKKIHEIKNATTIPLIAIGGINASNINRVFSAGADAAAVISSILTNKNIVNSTRLLVNKISRIKST